MSFDAHVTNVGQSDCPPAVEAARRFVTLVCQGERPSLVELSRALDELCAAYHETPEGRPVDYHEERGRTLYSERRDLIASRFVDLGLYSAISPREPPEECEPVYCDAIDDLADILGDLEDVLAGFEMNGTDDANWLYRNLYEIHWGRHLRHLSLYLYVKQCGGW